MHKPLALGSALLLAACAAEPTNAPDLGADAGPGSPDVEVTTSYLRDVQPIVERSCVACHVAGGVAPFSFEDPEAVRALAPAMLGAIEGGRMPPFLASADCNTYAHDPRLSADEVALFATWVSEGAPLGDPAEARHAEPIAPPTIARDVVMDIGGDFDATLMGQSDNYRCFVMDPGASEDFMVSGYEVIPGNRAIVHHVLAYLVEPAQVPDLEAMDAAEPGLGYECFSGGVGISGAVQSQVAGWVPGGGAVRLPEGTGLEVAAGSKIVIQVHYNLLVGEGTSTLDRTQLALQTAPAGSLVAARILPALKRNLDIRAGDAESVQQVEIPLPNLRSETTLYRFTGHMHLLGKQVRLEAMHRDGTSTCLLDIPRWDFQWQRDYSLAQPFTLSPGDKLKLTCVYDNSAENQPVVDGAQLTPRDVQWGESSLDEMCMTYIFFTRE